MKLLEKEVSERLIEVYLDEHVAVKKVSHDSGKQGMKQFVAEIISMGRLRHRNLVQLRGYCKRKGELLLVYDYMPNGSLDKVLYMVLVLITVGGAVYVVRKRKYEEVYEDWERDYSPHRFSYKTLYKATKGFKDSEVIGEGGFRKVYRGVLPSSDEQVAVKKVSHDSRKGMKQFVAEIVSMGRLRHRNLVQLRGYCRRKGELLLVYDYMPNGSLDKVLCSNVRANLNWFQRIRILRGVACGLLYLHEEWEQVVLHRDIKAGNVLLDADLNGKLGDFGLARLYDHDSIPQTTHLVGTVGYLAPELVRTGQATTSTDVYAFGAFMLEVACGRRPIELGKVYKGVLRSPEERIAIKRVTHDSGEGMKQFVAEIVSMGRLRHRNLVQLRGYCRRKGELLLVYDYMPNGSLDKILYGSSLYLNSPDQTCMASD
ncbi:hypothetical protein LWI29_001831 [Acer saccharum]|uniref:non-specific serine/threonine protein kinase n=1 Tax=Acer saccharum TaxID=4024 RepID=A0AA39VYK8_ACESA|nr:hypothetical protein LWI29_001831 [Acer saccharum]